MNTIHVDVVSAEESIFSGEAKFVALPGEAGELGIFPRHTPLISRIKAGSVRIEKADGTEEFIFVAGGIIEVQPNCVTVLSDTAIRGKDLDEEKANEAKAAAEEALKNAKGELDIAKAQSELFAMAISSSPLAFLSASSAAALASLAFSSSKSLPRMAVSDNTVTQFG